MTATIHRFRPNARTHDRLRRQREQDRDRLCTKIGICREDAPLYSEELRLLAYEESLKKC
jgi:hypothetical protein